MADEYNPVTDMAELIVSALGYNTTDPAHYAGRVTMRLRIAEDDSVQAVATALRKALGIPGPRTVTYDMAATDAYLVQTTALEEFAADQRYRARSEGGNPRRHQWADQADLMMHQANAARAVRDGG